LLLLQVQASEALEIARRQLPVSFILLWVCVKIALAAVLEVCTVDMGLSPNANRESLISSLCYWNCAYYLSSRIGDRLPSPLHRLSNQNTCAW
jgi:hypothetical protein